MRYLASNNLPGNCRFLLGACHHWASLLQQKTFSLMKKPGLLASQVRFFPNRNEPTA
jgi:hypothetical protein